MWHHLVSNRVAVVLLLAGVQALAQSRDVKLEVFKELPEKTKRYAVLVGVDEYEDKGIPQLRASANDARSLKKVLVEQCGFDERNVVVLATNEPDERRPKRGTILHRLDNVLGQVPKDGLFLFAFSGHGMEREGKAFLLPSDAHLADSLGILEEVALDVEKLRRIIGTHGIQQVLVLLDACRSDPEAARGDALNGVSEALVKGFSFDVRNREVSAFATLYATAVGDRSYEYNEKSQGYFMYFLMEGLRGKAANERGEVTLQSLLNYVQENVPKQVALDGGPKKRQRPFARVEGYLAEQLVLSVVGGGVKTGTTDEETEFWEQCKEKGDRFCQLYLTRFPAGKFEQLAKEILVKEGPAPGATRLNNKDGQKYVWIPAGRFRMGCSPGDAGCFPNESPAKEVEIPNGFWLGQTEVTVNAWRRYLSVTQRQRPIVPDFNKGWREDQQPVVNINWVAAAEFCRWIGGRLPTEAEWEYAARAGTKGPRYGELNIVAWFEDNSGKKAHAVGQRPGNPWGLTDMLGNVAEWVADSYGPEAGNERVYKGGGWNDPAGILRASGRYYMVASGYAQNVGCRCVWE